EVVALLEETSLARRGLVALGPRLRHRALARPDQHIHAERPGVTGDDGADPAIAIDAKRLAANSRSDTELPMARLQRGNLLRDHPCRGQHESPGQFGGGIGRRVGMLARRDDDAEPRAGIDVDMRINAALADQLQLRQPLQQRRANLRTLADQHQRLGILQPLSEPGDILDVVVPDRDIVVPQPGEAIEGTYRIEIVVEDGDLHDTPLPSRAMDESHRDFVYGFARDLFGKPVPTFPDRALTSRQAIRRRRSA